MGIVYHGSYLPWLEIGRTDLIRAQGFPYSELEAAGYLLPVLELSIKYRLPAKYDDEVTIHTKILEYPGIRINIEYELFRGDELLATASTSHAFINRQGAPSERFRCCHAPQIHRLVPRGAVLFQHLPSCFNRLLRAGIPLRVQLLPGHHRMSSHHGLFMSD